MLQAMRPDLQTSQQLANGGPIFIVGNGRSGHGDTDKFIEVTTAVLETSGRPFEFMMVEPKQLGATARTAVKRARAEGATVVAAGGDGTINTVANEVLGSGVNFGVLPQGTFNYFGREHGIPETSEAAAAVLLDGVLKSVQVGRVNGRVFLVNASLGLYPQLLEDRETYKERFGRSRMVAMISALYTLLRRHRQLTLNFESDNVGTSTRTLALFVGNNRLQLDRIGIEEAQSGALASGALVATVLRPISTVGMLGVILRGAIGQLGAAENVQSFVFTSLEVVPRRRRRIKVGTDGEVAWMRTPLTFDVPSERLSLLVPATDQGSAK